ncbi:MAG TPA: serine--glyoxylate aminotransferase, partial [Aliiroseovarius sp.]|nr:serine--glyoxylate aminotransferase [Aliiroseovarius sp.]
LDNVFARHARIAEGVRKAVAAWEMPLYAQSPDLYSNSVSAIKTPDGFDANEIVTLASEKYDTAFGAGLGQVSGKLFRIGHLGSLPDVLALAGIATAEMCMKDLGFDITLGAGVAAAQEHYRTT